MNLLGAVHFDLILGVVGVLGLLGKEDAAEHAADTQLSRRIYDRAFFETIKQTTLEEWRSVFHGFHAVEEVLYLRRGRSRTRIRFSAKLV